MPSQTLDAAIRKRYLKEGFCFSPPLLPADLLERVVPRMDAVIAEEYETGVEPHARHFTPLDPPGKIRKIDQPHLCDRTVLEVISHPALGEFAAQLTDAEWVQVWAVQLLVKPASSELSARVGWHQDKYYWPFWEGEVFTAWIAVSDVRAESGPMRYVPGSHEWGFLDGSDFFGGDDEAQRNLLNLPEGAVWNEVPAILPPGAVAVHHKHTLHGSGMNTSGEPRRSFAVHLRTNRSKPQPETEESLYYITDLDDPIKCPVIYGSR